MESAPVLVLGYNRPDSISKVFSALSKLKPEKILFAVDGPKKTKPEDEARVLSVQKSIDLIDWNARIETRFRDTNLGLRYAVPDAVDWAISKYGKVIVLEDDAIPGKDFLRFMNYALHQYESDKSVAHVSGYNQVPKSYISNPESTIRKSVYPESYAWGTWENSWKMYEDDIGSFSNLKFTSKISSLVWSENFKLAEDQLISTWAFRWINSIWQNNKLCIAPNVNLIQYIGHEGGTHTKRKPRAPEQPVMPMKDFSAADLVELDLKADVWTRKNIFHETPTGLIEIKITKLILRLMKLSRL